MMAMALLEKPLLFKASDVEAVLNAFPAGAKVKLHAIKKDGAQLQLLFDDVKITVVSMPEPMALRDFAKAFSNPGGEAYEPMIARHRAKLVVTCREPGNEFGQTVMSATIVHLLAMKLASLGEPLGGYWVASERLCDWAEFCEYGAAVMPAFENDPNTIFPSRYWVSVQLTQDAGKFGGETSGLRPFFGYELDLTPIPWPMADVAERLVGTVAYLFWHGSVLKDGETLGSSETERFSIRFFRGRLMMALISSGTNV